MKPAPLPRRSFILGSLAACSALGGALAAEPVRVVYPRHMGVTNSRYEYDWLVLRTALEKSSAALGPFTMSQLDEAMSPRRVTQELALPRGRINVLARGTSRELERDFLPVRIPIDKGLLGFRVFLIRAADLPRFAAVRTLQDLRRFRAGQGKDWVDIDILHAAGIPVVEGSYFDGLFSMLMVGRFDFFSRGVDEVVLELEERRARYPHMVIEPTLLLHYPLPRYLFVRRDAEGERLAKRLRAGLETMVQDGTLNALFRQHKGPVIEQLNLEKRRLIALPATLATPETPLNRPELWYNPQAER
ncbi:hypothetical protein [Pseudoduganella namucuonensis]|uniref:Transporter substrate-binding domain-containing protein n=1 Tax=Pseudoduganella namucuonensis TaxID=1035707 RepID=A0A1I7F249_9BURK|nr:hypothetical protein [Pseudoduganella namucuonensis]SFU30236.1 hypothetical protein SAMN05216552_1001324 [Pseudoduganella namucuonensis]